ncbi:CsbD family protein [Streptococcus caviae]|uniref:CsbD family protein n=1 Tax=Streptococcus sp. 'caviae' TaxID=1915004 RepID=UPI00094B8205|nr:CsbD family protein [Streptococcus sp. 'caviae']OLN84663.1 CsbD family protein [Streptococcus sp. 'caviae']
MSEEKFDAKLEQAKGSIKEGFGKLSGDKETETEGKVDKITGKAKEVFEDTKDTVEGAVKSLKKDDN